MKVELKCQYCGETYKTWKSWAIRRNGNYCSKSCFLNSGALNNSEKTKNRIRKIIISNCQICGKEIKSYSEKRKFCSNKCRGINDRKENKFIIENNITKLIINSPKFGELICLIDTEDINKIKHIKWCVNYSKCVKNFYVVGHTKEDNRKVLHLHRLVTNCPSNLVVDHINHNTLDNRKENLKICTKYENNQNINPNCKRGKAIRYICWHKHNKAFRVKIKNKYYGQAKLLEDAILIRDKVLMEIKNG